jgi:hypothetical protein
MISVDLKLDMIVKEFWLAHGANMKNKQMELGT